MNEFEVIRRFFTHHAPHTVLGVGDDAAIVRPAARSEVVISADMLVAGRHFLPDADPRLLGHKSLAVNLSDLAAMGATPRWATLALALPRVDAHWLAAFARGFMALARKHGVALIGGDTTRGPLTISVQIMGEVPRGQALRRDAAKTGDDVWVSGRIGEAALALSTTAHTPRITARERTRLRLRLDAPTPRIALGEALRRVAHSAIDISDGLIADLEHICERSHVSADIEWARVPVARVVRHDASRNLIETVLAGGDDYELCFTAPAARRNAVERAGRAARIAVTRIGRIVRRAKRTPLVRVLDAAGNAIELRRTGYDHFRE